MGATHRLLLLLLAAAIGVTVGSSCLLQRRRAAYERSNVLPAVCGVQEWALFRPRPRPCAAVGVANAVEHARGGRGGTQRRQADAKVLAHPSQQLVAANDDAIISLHNRSQAKSDTRLVFSRLAQGKTLHEPHQGTKQDCGMITGQAQDRFASSDNRWLQVRSRLGHCAVLCADPHLQQWQQVRDGITHVHTAASSAIPAAAAMTVPIQLLGGAASTC
jgi:hypothetical protein